VSVRTSQAEWMSFGRPLYPATVSRLSLSGAARRGTCLGLSPLMHTGPVSLAAGGDSIGNAASQSRRYCTQPAAMVYTSISVHCD